MQIYTFMDDFMWLKHTFMDDFMLYSTLLWTTFNNSTYLSCSKMNTSIAKTGHSDGFYRLIIKRIYAGIPFERFLI